MDKTGASYYGEQTLHYLAVNGETAVVQLRQYFYCVLILLLCESMVLYHSQEGIKRVKDERIHMCGSGPVS